MNEIERQILESLQFLLSMEKPESERYQDKLAHIMSKNHLLLNPIEQPTLAERTHDALSEKQDKSKLGYGRSYGYPKSESSDANCVEGEK